MLQVQTDTGHPGTPFANQTPTATSASSGEPHPALESPSETAYLCNELKYMLHRLLHHRHFACAADFAERRTGKGMPAVPEVLTSTALGRGPPGNNGERNVMQND